MKECINAVKERRSIVAFEAGKNIPEETLKEILNVANMSPSSMNLQPWEVKAVISPEKKKILRACANNQPKVEEASATLIIIANPKAVEENIDKVLNNWIEIGNMQEQSKEIYKKMSLQLYTDDIMSKTRTVFAVKNTAFFAMSIMIAARFFGFETHPMDGINEAEIKKNFNIEEYKIIPLLIAIGYPKKGFKLNVRGLRRPLDEFVEYL